ncbi:S-layer homology domain-containing protein [Peptococcaceae bacterium 1198_IL3148]
MRNKLSLAVALACLMTFLVTGVAMADQPQWVKEKNMAKDLYKHQEKMVKEMYKHQEKMVKQIQKNYTKFKDIQMGYPAYNEIYRMVECGIINGYQDGNFKPNVYVTREQFAKIFVLSMGVELVDDQSQSFVDVKADNMFYNYIETVKPYLTGYSKDGKIYFYPKEQVVREDVAVAIVRAKGLDLLSDSKVEAILDKYQDEGKISANLRAYVATAIDEGILGGRQDNKGDWYLDPQKPLKRVEAVLMLYRACNGFVGDEQEKAEKIIIEENDVDELAIRYVRPADGAKNVEVDIDELTIKFNIDIQPVDDLDDVLAGITITNLTEDEDVDIDSVEIDGNKLIIELEDQLDYRCKYRVEIAKNIIEDEKGNNFGKYSWSFSTLAEDDE